jgi:pseudouridine-5'-phosphate glycosidase
MPRSIDILSSVSSALNCNKPVVALESCVITHGLPATENVRTALDLEKTVREASAEPATIAVLDGRIKVGLTKQEIERLASGHAEKLAARDVPYAVTKGLSGGTTVSATMQLAAAAGILVVATGGMGGVHLGWAESGDVSADLWELTRAPVVLVCAGPKAVVDVAKTAEWLETHSIPVYGYGTDELPAFYCRSSGIKIPRVDDAREFADVARACRAEFGMRAALVLAVPVPEESAIDAGSAVEQALREARDQGIGGKDITPYLLSRVGELTGGRSLKSNIALLKNNARVAAEVACALSEDSDRRMGF